MSGDDDTWDGAPALSEDELIFIPETEQNFEITIDDGDGTETVFDPLVGVYKQSVNPWSSPVPDTFEVDIKIQVGAQYLIRDDAHQWRQTYTYTQPFFLDTTTYQYGNDLGGFCQKVWDFAQGQITDGNRVYLHAAVWLDNPTHPPTAAGVVRLPKGHRDVTYTQEDFRSAGWLEQTLGSICSNLKNTARY